MNKTYKFTNGIDKSEWFYSYSPNAKAHNEFIVDDGAIRNGYDESVGDYDYTSVLLKDKFSTGVTVVAECDFDNFGAPLIVLTDDITTNADRTIGYGEHIEIVTFEKGCNVWHLVPNPTKTDEPTDYTLLHFENRPIKNKERITLSVSVSSKELLVTVCDKTFSVKCDKIPNEFYIGFTACEGINRFYSFSVQNED